jgi:hypothetical protein
MVKVNDFGLGRLLHGATADDLAYASPERCRRPERSDLNDDVYAFGCLLYEMVCGRLPFAYQDRDALVAAHLGEPPQPPISLLPSLPPALDRLIIAALCKSPGGRPRTLRMVEEALGQIASGAPEAIGQSGWPATREEASSPRLTPLGHVHLRPRELRVSIPAASETPARRTPLGQAHLHLRGLVVDNRPAGLHPIAPALAEPELDPAAEPTPVLEPEAEAVRRTRPDSGRRAPLDLADGPARGRKLWWVLGTLVLVAGALVAARGLRARSLDAAALPAQAPLKP